MNKLIYKTWTFEDDQVKSGSCYMETSLPSSSLGINTLETVVKCADGAIADFAQNDPVTYFYKGAQRGIYYLQSVERIGPERYTLTAVSTLGLLAQKGHPGGIYTGQTVQEVVTDICGDIPVIIKSNLANIALYGWLPYVAPPKTSAKDNLSQVLFAIGAAVTNDLDGVLRIEPLWSGVSGVLDDDHVCQGGKVTTEPAVTAVSVTEHQYFRGGESKELFNGSTQAGDIITFGEPAYDLTADGFSILESGANYAKVSAGSGTLTGRSYIHNTRQVTVEVTPGPVENIKTPSGNPTLVSLVNAYAVAQRLAAYYKCRDTIKVSALIGGNRPGAVVSMYHPYDKKMVKACLAVTDAHMSAVIKADLEALAGFEPPDISEQEYYDAREVLTGEGEWIPPEGSTSLVAVLISAGQGGYSGQSGEDATAPEKLSTYGNYRNGPPSNGGAGGAVGANGKILRVSVNLNGQDRIKYSCGVGGDGGICVKGEDPQEGQLGGHTLFGQFSSENGEVVSDGYTDPVTGDVYAKTVALSGISGGKSAGATGKYMSDWLEGEVVSDYEGNEWYAGLPGNQLPENKVYLGTAYGNKLYISSTSGSGGGAAVGSNGTNGYAGNVTSSTAYTGTGGNGADASDNLMIPNCYGAGGYGGHGGGGAGACGGCGSQLDPGSKTYLLGPLAVGGLGGKGGKGADGCIILYYRAPKEVKSGAVMDKQGRFAIDRAGRLMVV